MRRDANRGRYVLTGAGRRRTPRLTRTQTKEGATIRKHLKILGALIMSFASPLASLTQPMRKKAA